MKLKFGGLMIESLTDPKPDEIDLYAIDQRLRHIRRFSNDPSALTVHQHRTLTAGLARADGSCDEVIDWCLHHDDHEAITGDIPGPIKALISLESDVLIRLEDRLDRAICSARGVMYPTRAVRLVTHAYDKAAETVEWVLHMGNPRADWNALTPPNLTNADLKRLLQVALATA